jgi:ADP-heptose:LPS heptosyltransferase
MEIRDISDHPLFRMRDGIGDLRSGDASSRDFAGIVTRLLDEFDAADFRSAERILDIMRRQGRTVSGFPRIRPADCERVIKAIRVVFEANRPALMTGDRVIVERFEQILEAFSKTDVRHYSRELMQVRALQAEARLLLQDPDGVRALIGDYADRIYKIQGDLEDALELLKLDCQARAAQGAVVGLGLLAIGRAVSLARLWSLGVGSIASEFIELIAMDLSARPRDGLLTWLLAEAARRTVRYRTPGGTRARRITRYAFSSFGLAIAAACLYFLRKGDIRFARRAAPSLDVVVTRAMGGFGDLLMMTPGLRALAKRHSTRVKLVVERKFFDIFRNNPHVELIDIDGPPIDVAQCQLWCNLTLCPAGEYEAAHRPFVKKGRVELFAAGMGVGKRALDVYGWDVEYCLDAAQTAFRDDFIRRAKLGSRPIVGVQPYSRDSYKDHPDIGRFIEALKADYDVIIFHHVETDFAVGPGVTSTAGLSLAQSIALVSALDALVCVDSGFLQAAAAFDVPAIAMFGPTDGKLFTRHHRRATVISASESYGCAPCWRNEDLPCWVTGKFGSSPCVSSLKVETVLDAVATALTKDGAARAK